MNQPYDVFISYAREDTARAQIVREKLEALGLNVFFDAEGIDSGQEFPVVIDRAVKSAKCVLGLWSQNAFEGRWVRIESRIGLDQGKLVAAVIDGTRPEDLPAEFYNVSIENLSNFQGQVDHPAWGRVLRAIGKRVGRSDLTPRAAGAPPPPPRPQSTYMTAPTMQSRAQGNRSGGGAARGSEREANAGLTGNTAVDTSRWRKGIGGSHRGIILAAVGGAAVAVAVLFFVMRGTNNPAPPATTPTEITDASGQDGNELGVLARQEQERQKQQPIAADLSGRWQGFYQQGENRTPFAVQIEGRPGTFRGWMAETNTFAEPASFPQLFANVRGETRADGAIEFTKTYNGTAGQTHSVEYQGRIDDGGRTISGVWSIRAQDGQELTGPFRMQRQ